MASPSTVREGDNWQTTRESIRERNKFMFNNSLLSDVKFVVRKSSEEKCKEHVSIPAHKYLLAIGSPVFFAMLYGDLAETGDTVELPDCDSEGFLELLQYLYCDEAELTGSNVMQVLYLAKKFIVPSLVKKCTEFLEHNLDAENVFAVLPQAKKFDEAKLIERCWQVVDEQTSEAIKSTTFVQLDRELLSEVVGRDSLSVKEVELFEAVDRWAASKCKKRGMEGIGTEKREVLGPIFDQIRFLLMSEKEFAGVVLKSGVLSLAEVTDMVQFFNNLLVADDLKFSQHPRFVAEVRQCKRFPNICHSWNYGGCPDAIDFTVDVPIVLMGCRLIGIQGAQYSVKMKVYKDSDTAIWSRENTYTATALEDCDYCGYDVMFASGILLQASSVYTIEATVHGPSSQRGTGGMWRVAFDNVNFTFIGSPKSKNGTSITNGQFPVLFFKQSCNKQSN